MGILPSFLALLQKIFYSLHSPLAHAIRLRIQWAGCNMSESVIVTELLKGSRCILGAVVGYKLAGNSIFLKHRFQVCNDCRRVEVGKFLYHRELAVVIDNYQVVSIIPEEYVRA